MDRNKIFEQFPWLQQKNLNIVSGNDLDAIISSCFLHEILGWNLIGFYNYESIWHDKSVNRKDLKEAVWVDLDVYQNIKSIGHHILKIRKVDEIKLHKQSLNPNLQMEIYQGKFAQKYPLGTIHFLLWLFEKDFPHTSFGKLLLWAPDSSWINAQKYKPNVKNWVYDFVPSPLLKTTLKETISQKFEKEMRNVLYPALTKSGFTGGRGQVSSVHLGLRGFRCNFKDPNKDRERINNLIKIISEITGWKEMKIPVSYIEIPGKRGKMLNSELRNQYKTLDNFLEKEKVFSYAVVERGEITYTTGISL